MRLAGEGSALHKKCGVYLQIVGVAQIPLNYEDRLTEMFARTFNHLRLLLSTHTTSHFQRSNEIHNVTEMTVKHLARTRPLDLDVLKNRNEKELRPDLGNPKREDLTLRLWIEAIEEERLNS